MGIASAVVITAAIATGQMKRKLMRKPLLIATLTTITLLLSACGATETPSVAPTATLDMSPAQEAALADGVVDEDEYEAQYRAFLACASEGGISVLDGGVFGNVHRYSVTESDFQNPEYERCYGHHFLEVDHGWQIVNEDLSETTIWLKACLRDMGIEPAETAREINDQFIDLGTDPLEACMND